MPEHRPSQFSNHKLHVKKGEVSPGIRRTGLSQTGEPGWTCRFRHPREEPGHSIQQSKKTRISEHRRAQTLGVPYLTKQGTLTHITEKTQSLNDRV
jgi:hypothetical protein